MMTNPALDTGTWRRKTGLATWHHRVSMSQGVPPPRALCDAAVRAWSVLDGFANVAGAAWTTLSAGEDARVETRSGLDLERLRSACVELGDVCTLDLDLDLRCLGLDGSEGIIEHGAKLVLDLDWPDPTDLSVGQPGLDIVLRLQVDIYAPYTGGHHPDNRALAALNGPRLSTFLRRLRTELGATLVDVDAYAGGDIANEDGFVGMDGSMGH
jgi:hypothetical protein